MILFFVNWLWWEIFSNFYNILCSAYLMNVIIGFFDVLNNILLDFLSNTYLVTTLQNVGLALVTLLFTLFIALLSKRKDGIDSLVVFPFIIDPKYILLGLSLIYTPFLFWNSFDNYLNQISLLIFVFSGIFIYVLMIIKLLEALLEEEMGRLRISFIKHYINIDIYWEKMLNVPEQEEMYDIFIKRINEVFDKSEFDKFSLGKFFSLLRNVIREKKDYLLFERGEHLLGLLRISYRLFKYRKKVKESSDFKLATHQINLLINEYYKFIEGSLDYPLFDLFFDEIDKVFNENKKEDQDENYALQWVYSLAFWSDFIKHIYDNPKKDKVYLPDGWLINQKNLEENKPARKLLQSYRQFVQFKILRNKGGIDTNLDGITHVFIGDINIKIWGIALSFFLDFFPNNGFGDNIDLKIRRYLSKGKTFGVYYDWYDVAVSSGVFDHTVELLVYLLKMEFSFSELELYIDKLNDIDEDSLTDDKQRERKKELLKVLSLLKDRVDKN